MRDELAEGMMMMGVLETRLDGPEDGLGNWGLTAVGTTAVGVGALRGWLPSVTDLRVIPWYVPVVSILNPSVSEWWSTLFYYTRGKLFYKLKLAFFSSEPFLIVTTVYGARLLNGWAHTRWSTSRRPSWTGTWNCRDWSTVSWPQFAFLSSLQALQDGKDIFGEDLSYLFIDIFRYR